MDIFVKVDGQKIVLPTNMKLITGSSNFIKLIFTLTPDWDDMNVKAIFTQTVNGEEVKTKRTLDDKNSCYVPSTLEEGKCVLTLYGVGVAGGFKKATANAVTFILLEKSYSQDDSQEDDPSGDDGDDEIFVATIDEVREYLGLT